MNDTPLSAEYDAGNQSPSAGIDRGLPSDPKRQFLDERPVILCRTCMRPLTWETRTEPGFLPREGWYDDAHSDPLVCFKAADYRHVPLTDREWAYYEAGQKAERVRIADLARERSLVQFGKGNGKTGMVLSGFADRIEKTTPITPAVTTQEAGK